MRLEQLMGQLYRDETPDAGGGGAPAVAPEGAPSGPEGFINDIVDEDISGFEDTPTGSPSVTPAAAPAPKPSATPPQAAEPPKPQPGFPAPAQQPVPPPPTPAPLDLRAQPQPSAQPPAQPAAPVAQPNLAELRKQQIDTLAAQHYQLSQDEARLMLVEPEKVIPHMAARLHVDVFEAVVNAVYGSLPQHIEQILQMRTARDSAEQEFYTEFPSLKDAKFAPEIESALLTYRHKNPTATRAQAIAAAGITVSLANGLNLPEKYMKGLGLAPQAPTPPQSAFQPASPGASSVPRAPGQPNYFAQIAEEDIVDGQ